MNVHRSFFPILGKIVLSEDKSELGIIIDIRDDVCIPPLITVMWMNGYISNQYSDDVCAIA